MSQESTSTPVPSGDKQVEEDLWKCHGAERGVWTEHLRKNRYEPKPIRRVWIPKPGSKEKRPLLMKLVKERISDGKVLELLEKFLKQGVMEEDMRQSRAHFDFLGYRFLRTAEGKLPRLVRPKSKKKPSESLGKPTKRTNGRCMKAIVEKINPTLRGWFEYFKHAHLSEHEEMDKWVRMRLRSILRKRRKGKGRGRGSDHLRWPNRYFENLGLFSLASAREEEMSLSKGATC